MTFCANNSTSLVDILGLLGWVHLVNVDAWRNGRIESLESLLPVPAVRLVQVCEHLVTWRRNGACSRARSSILAPISDGASSRFCRAPLPRMRVCCGRTGSPRSTSRQRPRLSRRRTR